MRRMLLFSIATCMVITVSAQQIHHAPPSNPPYGQSFDHSGQAATKGKIPQAQQLYSHGDPTPEEQLMLEYINRARANPPAEGERLATTSDPDVVQSYQYFGIDKNKVRSDFQNYPPRPPLAFHPKLIEAARNHSRDMKSNDFQGHTGSDGSTLQQRLQRVGYTGGSAIGENVFAYARSMWHAHCGFNVDWGQENQQTLGHRRNIMNFDGNIVYNEIGIGVIQDNNPATRVGPYIVTQNFSTSGQVYIVGVVYRDRNGNGFYDIGEGLSGVTITPSSGNYYTITSSSGGYAIPVTGLSGSITLTAQGNGITASKNVTLTGKNVKVDFSQDVAPIPLPSSPANAAIVSDTMVRLIWRSIPQAQRYHLQVASDSNFQSLMVNDSTIRDTTYALRSLRNRNQYFWRVRGRHATLGWSEFSTPVNFSVALPLQLPTLLEPGDTVNLASGPITFRWTSAGEGVDTYWIEIVSDTDSYDLIFDYPIQQDTVFVLDSPAVHLEPNRMYYWHVMVYDLSGAHMSPWKRFVTISSMSAVHDIDEQRSRFSAWYDPLHDAIVVRLSEEHVPQRVEVYSPLGSLLIQAQCDRAGSLLSARNLTSGVYWVITQNPDGIERQPVLLIR